MQWILFLKVFDCGSDKFISEDLYLQHRGWFNSSLHLLPLLVRHHIKVLFLKKAEKSKSLGNGVDPLEVINQMGADVFTVSPNIIKQAAEGYKKIRNTFRFLLGKKISIMQNTKLLEKICWKLTAGQ